jgi:hypothetical protein
VPVGIPAAETTAAVNVTEFKTKVFAVDETSVLLGVALFTTNEVVAEVTV